MTEALLTRDFIQVIPTGRKILKLFNCHELYTSFSPSKYAIEK